MAGTQPIHSMTDNWSQGGTTFDAIKMNVTDAASAVGSKLIDLQVGGSSRFNVDKNGNLVAAGDATFGDDLSVAGDAGVGGNATIGGNASITGLATLSAGTATRAGFNIPQRSDDPTAVANGDIWTRATGFFYRVAGTVRQAWDTENLPAPTNAELDAGTGTGRRVFSVADVWRAAVAALASTLSNYVRRDGSSEMSGNLGIRNAQPQVNLYTTAGIRRYMQIFDGKFLIGDSGSVMFTLEANGNIRSPAWGNVLLTDRINAQAEAYASAEVIALRNRHRGSGSFGQIDQILVACIDITNPPPTATDYAGSDLRDAVSGDLYSFVGAWRCLGFVTTVSAGRHRALFYRYA